MPYVDLWSEGDYASIWYTTNSKFGNVGGFKPGRPTVLMLHPTFLDSSWLYNQFGDPRLDSDFNLIAVDMRVCGMSIARPSGKHDSWVEAADLAFVHLALNLPPTHIFAQEGISTNCALRFAYLFPEMCLSLTLVNAPPPVQSKTTSDAYETLLRDWCFASDLDTFEHIAMEAATFVLGLDGDPDLQDDLISYWSAAAPPFRRKRILEMGNVLLSRTPLKPEVCAGITQPLLIIQGEWNEDCPVEQAELLVDDLVNVQGGAILYTVKGACASLCLLPSTASIAIQAFVKFISRLRPPMSQLILPTEPTPARMKRALKALSEVMEDPEIATRNPMSSLSFSCLSPDVVRNQEDALAFYGQSLEKALCPVSLTGRPLQRYSEHKRNHWFHSERDGLSYVAPNQRGEQTEKSDSIPQLQPYKELKEPVFCEVTQVKRRKRSKQGAPSVEKVILKGTIDKIWAPTAAISILPRHLFQT